MKYKKLKYFILIIISIIIIVRCVEDNTNGENKMESTTIASSLKKVDVNDYKKLDSLSEEIILRSRKDGRELVTMEHLRSGRKKHMRVSILFRNTRKILQLPDGLLGIGIYLIPNV